MNKTAWVAWREFTATVMTKGFVIGVVIAPLIMFGVMLAVGFLLNDNPPPVRGRVAIIDRSGRVADEIEKRLSPKAVREEMARERTEASAAIGEAAAGVKEGKGAPSIGDATKMAADLGPVPELTTERLPDDADPEPAKAPLRAGATDESGRIALVVVDPHAVSRNPETGKFGEYELFVKARLDDRVEGIIRGDVNDAIVHARLREAGLDPKATLEMTARPRVRGMIPMEAGSQQSSTAANIFVPFGFIMLLWISAFTGGQYLLTTTIEEKSNRIMEVLLSAVSPLQLMVGKIMGQMAVGLLVLCIYAGLGLGAVGVFGKMYLLSMASLGYLVVFFFIAFFLIAAMMAAVGSAVSEVHEAQSLIGPVMIVLIIPMALAMPIIRDPNSTLALTLSFIPPFSPFVMVMRIATNSPPPAWQIAASIAVGLAAVVLAAWAAAKIFRIGVLMYGKPPNFATLIRWVRMA